MNAETKFGTTGTILERKKAFLKRLTPIKGKMKYRRYVESPLRYPGGKSLAVGMIVEHIPDNTSKLVSPFFGAGSVEIACAKELGMEVQGYEIFDILVNYWGEQIKHPEALYKRLREFEPTRDEFKRIKSILKLHWDKKEMITNKLDLAALYYFNHNTSYGPHFLGWPSDIYLDEKRYATLIDKVRKFRVGNLDVKCASFETIMSKHKNDFMYCDPPYFLGGDSKMFIGLYPHRNFPVHHKGFKHELLRDYLLEHKGGFVLSYNDCSTIREWYKDFEFITPEWQYTFGQGDTRIGVNRANGNGGSHVKKSHELIIWKMP